MFLFDAFGFERGVGPGNGKMSFPTQSREGIAVSKLIFNGELSLSFFIVPGVVVLGPSSGGFGTPKADIGRRGGPVQGGPGPQRGGVVVTPVDRVHVTTTTDDSGLVLTTPHPFPHIARQIVKAHFVLGRIMRDRRGPPPTILGIIHVGKGTSAP